MSIEKKDIDIIKNLLTDVFMPAVREQIADDVRKEILAKVRQVIYGELHQEIKDAFNLIIQDTIREKIRTVRVEVELKNETT